KMDAIVTDMRMPGMDGASFLAEARRIAPDACRLILSGQADEAMALRALPVAHQFLHKPCDRDQIVTAVDRKCAVRDILMDADLRRLVVETKSLPSPAAARRQLHAALSNPLFGGAEVSAIIERDAALSAKFLQLANSAFFSLPHVVLDVREAIRMLGLPTIEHVLQATDVFETLPEQAELQGQDLLQFKRRTFAVANLASRIAEQCQLDACVARTAGMLHDIGVLVFAKSRPEAAEIAWTRAVSEGRTFVELEEAEIGATHAQLGASLLGVWGLPESIVKAIETHHSPHSETLELDGVLHIAGVLVAESMVRAGSSPEVAVCHGTLNPDWLQRVGRLSDLSEWQKLADQVFEASQRVIQ
ncbi:MAG: HDOD domain-containing protein, partial [Planctomycetota bacterium]